MKFPIRKLNRDRYPPKLLEIRDPPENLYIRGKMPQEDFKYLAVVGSRDYSDYGEEVCRRLIAGLSGFPIVIVSGLALGIDSIAHEAALSVSLPTIAIPGSGLDPSVIYPPSHKKLSERILIEEGCLLSEFDPFTPGNPFNFPKRNRIMAGLSDATLIVEGEQKSGTMITARLALDYYREVMAVPGSIFSKNSEGPHYLIRNGATPITSSKDILEGLGFKAEAISIDSQKYENCSSDEMTIIERLRVPISRDDLFEKLDMPVSRINSLLTILELKELIKESGGQLYLC